MNQVELTEAEAAVVYMLAEAWNAYCALPVEHPMEPDEFCRAIHAAQDKVLARPGRRAINNSAVAQQLEIAL